MNFFNMSLNSNLNDLDGFDILTVSKGNKKVLLREKIFFDSENYLKKRFGRRRFQTDNRLIVPVKKDSDDYNAILKLPIDQDLKKATVEYKNAYDVYSMLEDTKYVVHLIGKKPLIFKTSHPGMLMELGKFDLGTFVKNKKKTEPLINEGILTAITQVSKGVFQFHNKNYAHREIRPSQMIYIESRSVWCISDYGLAKNSDDTRSAKNHDTFTSPELINQKSLLEKRKIQNLKITSLEDIYQIGVSLYELITGDTNFVSKGNETGLGRRLSMYSNLDELFSQGEINKDMVYFIKKLTGPLDDSKLSRYLSIENFINEVNGNYTTKEQVQNKVHDSQDNYVKVKETPKKPKESIYYTNFIKKAKEFNRLLKILKNEMTGEWNTINLETIDKIVNMYDEVQVLSNHKDVKSNINRVEIIENIRINYDKIRDAEAKKYCVKPESKEDLIKSAKIGFLWGPPHSTFENVKDRKNTLEKLAKQLNIDFKFNPNVHKSRYTLEETLAEKTHYHIFFKNM